MGLKSNDFLVIEINILTVACGETRDSSLSESLKLDSEISACILSYFKKINSK